MPSILSPLRYPGSKRRLAKYISAILDANALRPALYVEPFAGGASVALQLLDAGQVEQIGLIEKDPLVAAFWQLLFSRDEDDLAWLVDQIRTVDVTLDQWHAYKSAIPPTLRERALACLYLNRTSFSGILAPGSGPLGGYEQNSPYKIDCRFPRDLLVARLQQAAALGYRVAFVWHADWQAGLARIESARQENQLPTNTFYYLDPPFFHKADRLYTHYFTPADHRCLRDTILPLETPWVLSYDYCDEVTQLYHDNERTHVELLYSASQTSGSRPVKELILTNLPILPPATRLW